MQEENTIVIDGTTSRYGRVRRGRRMANLGSRACVEIQASLLEI